MGNEVIKCFICKGEIKNADNLNEVVNLKLPTGKFGYVHIKHPGVEQEYQDQLAQG
jgi:hypothetical protein